MIEAKVAPHATYQSAERVLALLKSFDDTRTELAVAEIARTLGVHKSTASALAAALDALGRPCASA
jgi:DNA-binding IclR family transcriptional regulator